MLKKFILIILLFLTCDMLKAEERAMALYTDALAPIRKSFHLGGWYGLDKWRLRLATAYISIPVDHYPDQDLDRINSYWLGTCADYFFESDFFGWYLLGGVAYSHYDYRLEDGVHGDFNLWHWILGGGYEYYLSENWHIGGELRVAIPIGLISHQPLGDDNLKANRVLPSFSLNIGYRF